MQISAAGIKALTFDVFGTVVDWRTSLIAAYREFGAKHQLDIDWTAFVDELKSSYRPGMDAVRTGAWPWTNVDAIYWRALEPLLARHGISGISTEEKRRLNRAWDRCNPWPDSVAGLTRLKHRFIISTLSNGDVRCLVNMAKHGGLPWDCILCAEVFRHYKPDPQVYAGAIELLGYQPHEVMMVAAHNYDLAAARRHGMRTAFIPRPREFGPAQKTDLGAADDWDIIAADLPDLAARLDI